jgi:hypothetical protein
MMIICSINNISLILERLLINTKTIKLALELIYKSSISFHLNFIMLIV